MRVCDECVDKGTRMTSHRWAPQAQAPPSCVCVCVRVCLWAGLRETIYEFHCPSVAQHVVYFTSAPAHAAASRRCSLALPSAGTTAPIRLTHPCGALECPHSKCTNRTHSLTLGLPPPPHTHTRARTRIPPQRPRMRLVCLLALQALRAHGRPEVLRRAKRPDCARRRDADTAG